jgi:hypothetical protein
LAFARHEYVARLDIAVHHQVAVGVRHRVAHGNEQTQPRRQIAMVLAAPVRDRLSVDQFDGHVGQQAVEYTSVQQSRDARML